MHDILAYGRLSPMFVRKHYEDIARIVWGAALLRAFAR